MQSWLRVMFSSRVRGWHFIVSLVAIAAGGVLLAIFWNRATPLDATAMTAYLPKREAAVLYLDVRAVRDSGVLDKIVGSVQGEEAEYTQFLKGTGFDYKRDLDRVLLSSAESLHQMLLQGRFKWDKLEEYAKQNGGSCANQYCSLPGSSPGRVVSFHKLGANLMALSSGFSDRQVREIVPRKAEPLPFAVPDKPVWVYLPASAIRNTAGMPSGTRLFAKALENAEYAVATLGPEGQNFDLAMNIACRSQEDAATLRAQLEGITGMLNKFINREKQTPNAADFSGILTAGTFQREQATVVAHWPIQQAFFNKLAN